MPTGICLVIVLQSLITCIVTVDRCQDHDFTKRATALRKTYTPTCHMYKSVELLCNRMRGFIPSKPSDWCAYHAFTGPKIFSAIHRCFDFFYTTSICWVVVIQSLKKTVQKKFQQYLFFTCFRRFHKKSFFWKGKCMVCTSLDRFWKIKS